MKWGKSAIRNLFWLKPPPLSLSFPLLPTPLTLQKPSRTLLKPSPPPSFASQQPSVGAAHLIEHQSAIRHWFLLFYCIVRPDYVTVSICLRLVSNCCELSTRPAWVNEITSSVVTQMTTF